MLQLKTLPKTRTSAMSPLRVLLLLWTLLSLGRGNVSGVQEEIFTRPGSDLLLPIRRHLTLSHTDGRSCDQYEWTYKDLPRHNVTRIARHKGCSVTTTPPIFPNTRTSENGSLIIDGVTRDNDGVYRVVIHNSTGSYIQTDDYTVHVEVPVSVPVLNVSCLRNGSAEISCRVEEGTKPNISVSVIGGSPGSYFASSNHITAIVGSPGPWNITCSVENRVSRLEMSRAEVTCPVPLSDIAVSSSCLPDGSAEAVCSVRGSDPCYSWRFNEESKSKESRVTLPPPVSGTLRCDVTNQINNLSTSINISCTVPVSDPVLEVTCLHNGSSEISCRVEKGTDLSIFLTVIGGSEGYNVTSSEQTVRVTVPPVSPPDSWNISCLVKNNIGERSTNEIREPCPAPLSTPHVNVSCHADGSASVSCVLEEDRDVTYNWTVIEKSHYGDHSRNITLSRGEFSSGPLNVSCSVYRKESTKQSNKTQIYCPAPLSTPHVNVSCHADGSASVSCVLEEDHDVTYNWTVNGDLHDGDHSHNITFNKEELNNTVPMNVSCSVYNSVSTKESNKTQINCPDLNSTSCLTCFQKSLIGGTLALMVTMPPLFISHWYIVRGMKKKS